MSRATTRLRLGTRGSALARWQTHHVQQLLQAAWPQLQVAVEVILTRGDRTLDTPLAQMGGKGLFTAELEVALLSGSVDCAVHSLKDLPTADPTGLIVGAVPPRADPADVLISRSGHTLESLPTNAAVGTSSPRRAAQLRHQRPDLRILDIRGNVDTRIHKALDPTGPYDAIVLAHAGLARLGQLEVVSQVLGLELLLPAPGQGALGIQCRAEDELQRWLAPIHHPETFAAVSGERAFLAALGGGCTLPIGALGRVEGEILHLQGRVTALDGSRQVHVEISGPRQESARLGGELAHQALTAGAGPLLAASRRR